jgi:hypothetical protein
MVWGHLITGAMEALTINSIYGEKVGWGFDPNISWGDYSFLL